MVEFKLLQLSGVQKFLLANRLCLYSSCSRVFYYPADHFTYSAGIIQLLKILCKVKCVLHLWITSSLIKQPLLGALAEKALSCLVLGDLLMFQPSLLVIYYCVLSWEEMRTHRQMDGCLLFLSFLRSWKLWCSGFCALAFVTFSKQFPSRCLQTEF